jgi:hypothetical protein
LLDIIKAERLGFEPRDDFRRQLLSRQLPSAARPPLLFNLKELLRLSHQEVPNICHRMAFVNLNNTKRAGERLTAYQTDLREYQNLPQKLVPVAFLGSLNIPGAIPFSDISP